ncbi:hypothetical protein KDA_33190 [Dictyobacter alpinus]|uniref:Uncharacterized protein n=1 Tax=Dictyobacter alpinus TaxID=2014873 RepID=A0A402B912_9CHLR|nr:tetratricopeptide repeat protein [Dictyobacter alpinus]GCE27835.1 hypothetical protein KDA_33190 [Dictyobacter alpinus]
MSSKKQSDIQLSSEENTQVEAVFSRYPSISQQLHSSQDQTQIEAALQEPFSLSEAAQISLVKSLAKANTVDAADMLVAINALSPQKEVRKEARRGLLRLEGAKIAPKWVAPTSQAPAVKLSVSNPPRFVQGFATQSREEGEIQVVLNWEYGYDYGEARICGFLLDFWNDGVKDFYMETGTKRHVENHVKEMRQQLANVELVSCSLAEAKRLIDEALAVNDWHKTQPAQDYRTQLPLLQKLIFQAAEPGTDNGQTFVTPELEEQEVVANFIGAWSFGDYGLAYDLLTTNSPARDNLDRDEWVTLHRAWFDEAHPTRMELGFIHEGKPKQSAIWLPGGRTSAQNNTKILEVGWSVELLETPLNGTIKEMPMGTAINKETGRYWFWNNYTLTREQNVWRIQQIEDEGAALQGLSINELQNRIKEYEDAIDAAIKTSERDTETFIEEMSWRLGQLLHFEDALIAHLPLDYTAYEEAYGRAVLTGNPERIMVYLDRIAQRFPQQHRADTLRRLGSTLAELAFKYDERQLGERHRHLLQRAEEVLQEAATLDNSTASYTLLGELLMSLNRNDEARATFLRSRELLDKSKPDPKTEAAIEAGLGNVAMRQQKAADSIPHYQRVAELDANYPGVWFSLGFAHRQLGQMDQAESYYQQALAQDDTDVRTYSELTAIYMQRAQADKAKILLQGAISKNPGSANLHALLASVLAEAGDKRQAVQHLEEAERLDPESDFVPAVRQQIAGSRKRI